MTNAVHCFSSDIKAMCDESFGNTRDPLVSMSDLNITKPYVTTTSKDAKYYTEVSYWSVQMCHVIFPLLTLNTFQSKYREWNIGGKMVYLKESIDSFLSGLVTGLAVSIFISICFLVVDDYNRAKQIEYMNIRYEQEKNILQGLEVISGAD